MKTVSTEIKVTVKENGEEVIKNGFYDKLSEVSSSDLLELLTKKNGEDDKLFKEREEKVLSSFMYGWNMKNQAPVRQAIVDANAGPDKAIDKIVKDFVKLQLLKGVTITEAEGRAKLEAAGMI